MKKVLILILIILSVVFLGLQLIQYEAQAAGVRALLMVSLTSLYCLKVSEKRPFFFLFLITFTVAEILNFISWYVDINSESLFDYYYYIGNGLYILSYIFLIIRVLRDMNLVEVIKKFPLHILLLLILDVFFVSIVTDTTQNKLTRHEYSLEYFYNAIIMLLVTVALINFMYRENKKAMNLLVGSIFIVFSEVVQMAYFYVAEINILNVLCSIFLILAFLFFYLQANLPVLKERLN